MVINFKMTKEEYNNAIIRIAEDMGVRWLVDKIMRLEKENMNLQEENEDLREIANKLDKQVKALLFTVQMKEAIIRELRNK